MPQRFLIEPLLMNGDRRHDLPLVGYRTCLFARTSLACMAGMSYDITVHLQPGRFPFQFTLQSLLRIGFTGKTSVREMPAFLLPTGLGCSDLPLQARLRTLLARVCTHNESAFGSLR
jgi:hypothetical protein